jgi:ketosteroid isomerase-like protein
MPSSAQVAEAFFDAWTGKDFERARTLVHADISFEGGRLTASATPTPTLRRWRSSVRS